MTLFKYSGAGNDFFLVDGRNTDVSLFRQPGVISALCDRSTGLSSEGLRTGSDGLIILGNSSACDFSMEYFNPDGSGGMMCGNGGRCIVAFAARLGIVPATPGSCRFEAPDGIHEAGILSFEGNVATVRLGMKDVRGVGVHPDGMFLDTGTRHFVTRVPDVETLDVDSRGRTLRFDPRFAPVGTNVNFISTDSRSGLSIRTFEKGVEAETLACGTGITASALAAFLMGIGPSQRDGDRLFYRLRAREATLTVDFVPGPEPAQSGAGNFSASQIHLTGPAALLTVIDELKINDYLRAI